MHGLIPAPSDPNKRSVWREHLHAWRSSTRHLLNYDDSLYCAPEFAWIPRCYTLAVVMMNDLQFYDGGYRLDAFLDEAEEAFGGFDAVLLWHAYPRIGFDDRNQFDFYRQMPGDLAGLRSLVDQCHQRNVRVYVDYNPWDTGTRREHQSDIEALVELVQAIDADAIFLDTMSHAAAGLREKLDAVRPGVTLESEVLVPLEHLDTHPSSWAQGFADGPGVLRNKWFERRHMQHRVKRWQHDHTPELHTAWMNGAGMIVWENVFGSLVAWCERDKSILRAMSAIQRRYHHLFCGERWTPLTPTLHNTVDASLWEDDTTRLWTLVNHSEQDISGEFIAVPFREGERYYAPVQGDSIMPTVESGQAVLKGRIRARGIGAFLATSQPPANMPEFLGKLAALETRANFDATPPPRIETLRSAPKTKLYAAPLPNLYQFAMKVSY
jgi:hypothetical protein